MESAPLIQNSQPPRSEAHQVTLPYEFFNELAGRFFGSTTAMAPIERFTGAYVVIPERLFGAMCECAYGSGPCYRSPHQEEVEVEGEKDPPAPPIPAVDSGWRVGGRLARMMRENGDQ
jgi:hypothetical protein